MSADPARLPKRLLRLSAVLALLPLMSGCVAAVALPLVAGSTLYVRQEGAFVRAATPVEPGTVRAGPSATPAPAVEPGAVLTSLVELPPPTPGDSGVSPWQPFIDHALARGVVLAEAARPESALIVAGGSLIQPQRRPCPQRYPAVIVDLDEAGGTFAPDLVVTPSPGLAAGLARLREGGIVVLWLSDLPAVRAGEVAGALRASGLDPERKDQLLLIRDGGDRKQALREQANEDVCVVAIAGDERSDFDELFDYLRDPAGAAGLDAMIGDGWFLVPPPLQR